MSTELTEDFPSLAGDLKDQPTVVLQSIGLAVSQVFCIFVDYNFDIK